jgi:hypothetical protein
MIAIYGTGTDTIDIGPHSFGVCARCTKPSAFNLVLRYRYYHLCFELGAVVEKRHFLVCQACGDAVLHPAPSDIDTSKRIPPLRRYGLYAWLAFALAVSIPVLISEYSKLLR